jgi:hypothetical protein
VRGRCEGYVTRLVIFGIVQFQMRRVPVPLPDEKNRVDS